MKKKDIEYGLDYAMERHNIERLEEVSALKVNEKLALGWKAFHAGVIHLPDSGEDSAFWFIMGVPRPKYCIGEQYVSTIFGQQIRSKKHERAELKYHVRHDMWWCPCCHRQVQDSGQKTMLWKSKTEYVELSFDDCV